MVPFRAQSPVRAVNLSMRKIFADDPGDGLSVLSVNGVEHSKGRCRRKRSAE